LLFANIRKKNLFPNFFGIKKHFFPLFAEKKRKILIKLTNIIYLQNTVYQQFTKKLHLMHKKKRKKRAVYQKNIYLCNVLINMIVLQI